jgi:hypothetical protein
MPKLIDRRGRQGQRAEAEFHATAPFESGPYARWAGLKYMQLTADWRKRRSNLFRLHRSYSLLIGMSEGTEEKAPLGLPCPTDVQTDVREQIVKLDSLGPMVVHPVCLPAMTVYQGHVILTLKNTRTDPSQELLIGPRWIPRNKRELFEF